MEIAQQHKPLSSSIVVWESRIKELEDEKVSLQHEISKIRDLLSVAELEKKFRALEEEVLQLRTTKLDLEGQLGEQSNATIATTTAAETPISTPPTAPVEKQQPAQTAETAVPAPQNRPSNEASRRLRHFSF